MRTLVLLALAAALAGCGRAERAAQPAASAPGRELHLEVSSASGALREGSNELRVRVRDAAGAPVDDARVSLDYAMEMAGMAPMRGSASGESLGQGEYRLDVDLAMNGTWQLELAAEGPSGESARERGTLRTGGAGVQLEGAAGARAAPGEVRIDPHRLQQIGVRFAEVRRAPLVRQIRALGSVTWDESKLVDVAPRTGGFVRDLRADAVGVKVEKGAPLFSVYSPDLYAAQAEYLRVRASGNAELTAAARARLRLWDVAGTDVAELERRGAPLEAMPVRAPASGFVVEKNAVEGAAFAAGTKLLRIAPLDRVWIEAQVYAWDLPFVAAGQGAVVTSPFLPGRALEARVDRLLPSLASETRTGRVRLELGNGDLALRPEMFVDVELRADLGERLLVPVSAVIVAGPRRVVFVDLGEGRLAPRTVTVGASSGEEVAIESGLAAGERVVASGNFLIAAESRIQSALEQW